jgi:hypothetical protein
VRTLAFAAAVGLSLSLVAGCPSGTDISIEEIAARLIGAVGPIQARPQALPPVLVQEGHTIIINASVTIINDPVRDLVVVELPTRTVLGFENDTGWDIYIRYYADDELQGVYVYDGEVLLLDYPCLSIVELISEDDIDPGTGLRVDSFDLTGADFFNPEDFYCGDAFILTFDPWTISARAEVIPLLR